MNPADAARLHAREDALAWACQRADAARKSAKAANSPGPDTDYLIARAEWFESVAAGIAKQIEAQKERAE